MVIDVRMVILVALILVGIGALLLFLIAWLRKDEARYFQFQLLAHVFLVLLGTMMSMAPKGAALPLWIFGIAMIVTSLFSLAWLVALRFSLAWLIDALSGGKRALRCSFCGKNQRYVKKLIAGPGIYICDDCVEICQRILDEPGEPQPETPAPQPTAT